MTDLSCQMKGLFIIMILNLLLFFFRFKMKVGVSVEDDRRRAKIIREEIGMDKPLVNFQNFPSFSQLFQAIHFKIHLSIEITVRALSTADDGL